MKNFFLGMIITLVVLGIGIGGYFLGQKNAINSSPKNDFTEVTPTVTSIPENSELVESTPTPTIDEGELIKAALFKKNNWSKTDDITVKVSTNDGKYASGTATSQGGGGYFYAVKDNDIWIIVADGNGVIECSSLTDYPDYPKTLISECYDTAAKKSVKR